MKKHILAACSIVAISGMGLAAQQPQPITPPTQQTPPSQPAQRPPDPAPSPTSPTSQPPATRPDSPVSDMARTATTVTGCLKTWDSRTMAPATGSGSGAGSAAAATTATAPGASAQFVLSNVERTGAASRTGASSFLLKTSDSSVSFSQHLNHKVEVTGTMSDSADKAMGDKAMGDKPAADRDARDTQATGRVSASDMKLPTLTVTALKMLSPTCGTGSN